jgi:hypothetical protein
MRTRAVTAVLSLLLAAVAPTVAADAPSATPSYRIIVHPANPATSVRRIFLQDAFLKKTARWPGNQVIHPADLTPRSPVRRRFSEEIIGRSVKAVKAYWQQRIFAGREVPPPEFDADEQVVAYVLQHHGAVGYVTATADLRGTKVVTLTK